MPMERSILSSRLLSRQGKKRGQPVCRFNFLLPPMPKTMILEALSETDLDKNIGAILKKALERIRVLLNCIKPLHLLNFFKS